MRLAARERFKPGRELTPFIRETILLRQTGHFPLEAPQQVSAGVRGRRACRIEGNKFAVWKTREASALDR